MLLVTGGAGFIGSNVVAALNDAGRADVAVCDFLGSDGKWRNLAKRQLVDVVPPAQLCELAGWPQARRHHSHGRDFGNDGNRRRSGDRDTISGFRRGCSIGARRTPRPSSMLRRPRPMATATRVSSTIRRSMR